MASATPIPDHLKIERWGDSFTVFYEAVKFYEAEKRRYESEIMATMHNPNPPDPDPPSRFVLKKSTLLKLTFWVPFYTPKGETDPQIIPQLTHGGEILQGSINLLNKLITTTEELPALNAYYYAKAEFDTSFLTEGDAKLEVEIEYDSYKHEYYIPIEIIA